MKVKLQAIFRFSCSYIGLILMTISGTLAQQNLDISNEYVKNNLKKYDLLQTDIENWIITDNYVSKHNGVNHIYYQQTMNGIPVEDAIMNINVSKEGKVIHANSRFIPNLNLKAKGQVNVNAKTALAKALSDLKIAIPRNLTTKSQMANARQESVFEKFGAIDKEMVLKLIYIKDENQNIKLTWVAEIQIIKPEFHIWMSYIDATTGDFLKKIDMVLHCKFDTVEDVCFEKSTLVTQTIAKKKNKTITNVPTSNFAGDSYNVYAMPIESPNHGSRNIQIDPANLNASPYGWHDTNGSAGAEYTITRGNNVLAQEDQNGNNGTGYSPDGGPGLNFDFTLDFTDVPGTNTALAQNLNSSLTNLFYWNNIIHDVFYNYGFDEPAGNFQQNNYGKGGTAGDYVLADGLDGSGLDNANFSITADGTSGRMQMYLWSSAVLVDFNVTDPFSIAGNYNGASASFGPNNYNITGNLIIANDGGANPSEACGPLINGGAIAGNIAIIDRGNCEFGTKVLNAQNAGAIAAIVCNNVAGSPINMAPGADGPSVTIPSIMISQSDCALIKVQIPTVSISLVGISTGNEIDGSFDNGIVAHEYGHGISTRLTGGPSSPGCLSNEEQGGEGWSDFFGLVLTHEVGDSRNTIRGIGTYAGGEAITGGGIRSYPYTADMNVNPFTYNDIITEVAPHGVGSVLCTMLWDMYWDFVDRYGYDPDIYNGTGGNNIAIQLVMDGLKLQPCSPGFTDVRNAILLADEINNNGTNRCLIWGAFARRGLGLSADQGLTSSKTDGIEAFDLPNDIFIEETIPIEAAYEGEVVSISNKITCGCTPKNDIQFKHSIPNGLEILSIEQGQLSGNDILSDLVNLGSEESLFVEYTARMERCNNTIPAVVFLDNVEGSNKFTTSVSGNQKWVKNTAIVNSPSNSWYAQNYNKSSNVTLTLDNPILISEPTELSFYHRFQTEETWDGGVVEISTNGGANWLSLDKEFISNGYQLQIAGNSGTSIQGQNAFTGNSNTQFSTTGFVKSVISLCNYVGKNVLIRFKFASDNNTNGGGINGWYIDDIEFLTKPAKIIKAYLTENAVKKDSAAFCMEIKDLNQSHIYVNESAIGKRYGGDWQNAFISLQDALEIAECNSSIDQIWVKEGTYLPTETNDQSISFKMVNGISIFGGFNGTESTLGQRDPMNNVTILSGDIGIPDEIGDNSFHVINNLNIDNTAKLDGFTITNGNAESGMGGGMLNATSSPVITNCIFSFNSADLSGGGIANLLNSSISLTDCSFIENSTLSGVGRAIQNNNSLLILENITIFDQWLELLGNSINNEGIQASITSKGLVEIKKE